MKFPWELWTEIIEVGLIGGRPLLWQVISEEIVSDVTFMSGPYGQKRLVPRAINPRSFKEWGFVFLEVKC